MLTKYIYIYYNDKIIKYINYGIEIMNYIE